MYLGVSSTHSFLGLIIGLKSSNSWILKEVKKLVRKRKCYVAVSLAWGVILASAIFCKLG